MGNLPSNRKTSQVEQSPSKESDIDIETIKHKINPHAVFDIQELSKSAQIEYIQSKAFRRRYRELAMKHHPDRGGSQLKFKIIQFSYGYLIAWAGKSLYMKEPSKTDNELRQKKQVQPRVQEDNPALKKHVEQMMKADPESFRNQFNRAFKDSQIDDYTKDGYDIAERESNIKRSMMSVKRVQGVTQSNLSDMFEKNTRVNTALIVRKNQQPEGTASLKQAYYEYGKKKEDDYGRFTSGASDYHIAYAGERLVDVSEAAPQDKQLTGKVSLDMAKQVRSRQNIKPEMTDKERELWASREEQREFEEAERLANMADMDHEISNRQNIFIERMLTFNPTDT